MLLADSQYWMGLIASDRTSNAGANRPLLEDGGVWEAFGRNTVAALTQAVADVEERSGDSNALALIPFGQ